MASFTTGVDYRFPPGTTLRCYRASGALLPDGAAVTTGVVSSDGTTTFDGLENGRSYLAGESQAGPFVAFQIPATVETPSDVGGLASFTLLENADTGWPARPVSAQSGTWIGWNDPSPAGQDLMQEYDLFIPIPPPA